MTEPRPRPRLRLDVPDDLVSAVHDRRVIPFVGAGFSAGLGMPDWESLLRGLAEEVDSGLDFDQIKTMANGDYLQIAEFLYIKSDKRIGPLRHVIEGMLGRTPPPTSSSCHTELVNLGAPQIYTTNYDDLIEQSYRALGVPTSVVALPKDVANSGSDRVQIVKYHGDLRHENTLVLTESAYYRRLDLESPMDLKFRSDILGRSVLFMGYSFRDVNIRLIWFKLMQMMQDIPPDDRRASYIVKTSPNPVQDALFRDVGLTPITLDPRGEFNTEDRTKLLADFLLELATRAGGDSIPGTGDPMFASTALLARIPKRVQRAPALGDYLPENIVLSGGGGFGEIMTASRRFLERRLPASVRDDAGERFQSVLNAATLSSTMVPSLIDKIVLFGPSDALTTWTCNVMRGGNSRNHAIRDALYSSAFTPWSILWGGKLSADAAAELIKALQKEIKWTARGNADEDLVFLADLVTRIREGHVCDTDDDLTAAAVTALQSASEIYPALGSLAVEGDARPSVSEALEQVGNRVAHLASSNGPVDSERFFTIDDLDLEFDFGIFGEEPTGGEGSRADE
ncbi:SIR2 family protein [Cellulomonas sp. 179-A 4D5 NHS]|uniref:SIR2 family protein n=1 Tax=Cellulomonas sp. 179-A 4D5 NHS TaxID=3142378 RepID=UPI0039A0A924